MDAKSKMSFINSIKDTTGNEQVCPKCGNGNKADCKFCVRCGTELSQITQNMNSLDNKTSEIKPTETTALKKAETVSTEKHKPEKKYVEPKNTFAQGLPEWSLEPPMVVVRRH